MFGMDFNEFVAGSVGGITGQIIGHPLDTVKVKMQTEGNGIVHVNGLQSALRTYTQGGLTVFFRGLSLPLLSKSIEQCIAFGVHGWANRVLEQVFKMDEGQLRSGIAGTASGVVTAGLLTPVYLVKVQLQVTARKGLSGPLAAIKKTIASKGFTGLYTGATPIILGTSIGYTFRFIVYDRAVQLSKEAGLSSTWAIIIGGGFAGMATWASHYPLDLVSARMQASTYSGESTNMMGHFREVIAESGILGLFRGLGPCLLRAFPVNAAIFLGYETTLGYISAISESY